MKNIGQGLDLVFILVAVLDCDDVDILLNRIAVSRLGCKCIIRNGETVLKSVVAVDDAECYRGKLLRNLRCLNLDDLKIVRIVLDVIDGCIDTDTIIQCDQAFLLQKQKCSCLVGGIVRDCDCIAVSDFIEALLGAAVNSERLIVNLAVGGYNQMSSILFVEGVQIINVLEIVRVKISGFDNIVRLYIILEDGNLKIPSFLSKDWLCLRQDFRVRRLRCLPGGPAGALRKEGLCGNRRLLRICGHDRRLCGKRPDPPGRAGGGLRPDGTSGLRFDGAGEDEDLAPGPGAGDRGRPYGHPGGHDPPGTADSGAGGGAEPRPPGEVKGVGHSLRQPGELLCLRGIQQDSGGGECGGSGGRGGKKSKKRRPGAGLCRPAPGCESKHPGL